MVVNKIIYTNKSFDELMKYLNTLDFFEDFLKIIEPIKYEIFTDADIERNNVTWPVNIVYEDVPKIPLIGLIVPHLLIEQSWKMTDDRILKVNIKSKMLGSKLFEMDFKCIFRYLGDIEIQGEWIEKTFLVPDAVLGIILEQFESILEKILN